MRPRLPFPALFGAALSALAAVPLLAQAGLGGAPDGGPLIPTKESFQESLSEAPWAAGAWRFQPWLGLRDASLVSNQVTTGGEDPAGESEYDFTLTAGAGLRAYLPTGKLIFTAHALPEYVWWQEDEDKRHLNGRYGAALFGYFNRMRFELSARLTEQQSFFSREVQQLTSTRQLENRAQVEFDIARGISLYGYAAARSFEGNEDDLVVFRSLDRDDQALGLGLRLESARGWSAHLAFEDNSTDFEPGARDLSNDGQKVGVGLGLDRRRFKVNLALNFEELEPTGSSALEPYSEAGGSLQLLFEPSEKLELAAYALRNFGYSTDADLSHYTSQLQGLRVRFKSRRGAFGLFGSIGKDEYEGIAADAGRVDDVTELGAQLDFRLRRLFVVAATVLRRDYDSSDDFYDRDVTSFGLSVQLGELAERLRFGSDSAAW
jgi:hypothetical protein